MTVKYGSWNPEMGDELKKAAKVAVDDVLAVQKGERVLIITNPDRDVQLISQAVFDAALDVTMVTWSR